MSVIKSVISYIGGCHSWFMIHFREQIGVTWDGMIEFPLDPCSNKTGNIWHIFIEVIWFIELCSKPENTLNLRVPSNLLYPLIDAHF